MPNNMPTKSETPPVIPRIPHEMCGAKGVSNEIMKAPIYPRAKPRIPPITLRMVDSNKN